MSAVLSISDVLAVIGALLAALLGIISFFLMRLLDQFDRLTDQVCELNETMIKIDKDLSGDVLILKEKAGTLQSEVSALSQLWDRLRGVETDIAAMKESHCYMRKGDKCAP